MEAARRNPNTHHYVGLAEILLQMWKIEQRIKVTERAYRVWEVGGSGVSGVPPVIPSVRNLMSGQ